jgi:hypothetical protein
MPTPVATRKPCELCDCHCNVLDPTARRHRPFGDTSTRSTGYAFLCHTDHVAGSSRELLAAEKD